MNHLSIKALSPSYWVVIISFVVFALYLINPAIIPWLVVIFFVILTLKLTLDGVKLHNQLPQELQSYYQQLSSNIYTRCQGIKQENREKINRLALIEKTYNEHPKLQVWEKKKRYYQLLPNLLLAMGLLGTFVGITINLILLSRNTAGEIQLQKALADIISSMAIAFVSSLVALVCSVFLTKFHPAYDLDIEKDNLISRLEDYIDNDYLLSQTPLSVQEKINELRTSIDIYASKLDIFVSKFPQYVKDFEHAVTDASRKLVKSADEFGDVTKESSKLMQTGANTLSNTTNNLAGITRNFSNLTSTLSTSAQSLDSTTEALQNYTQELQSLTNTLVNNSSRIQNLIQNNQQDLNSISIRLEQNTHTLSSATQSFNLNASQVKEALNQHTGQVGNHNYNIQNVAITLDQYTQIIKNIQTNLTNLVNLLNQSQNP
ncbi:hypothetical protein [Iningainema tapete]|uniref:MotA/TolQ/ExbB proton channel domain-containing protein n=1 Tax=Iningainema tapete BLCC-T55 TaxID=2748662 RepID=A0A8J6XHT4_9CYAN|nr:hypothetical protein [Iningainema tapete]MBD2774593.1 hypothetical protein [Iningainema tapete BLCC-T55]